MNYTSQFPSLMMTPKPGAGAAVVVPSKQPIKTTAELESEMRGANKKLFESSTYSPVMGQVAQMFSGLRM